MPLYQVTSLDHCIHPDRTHHAPRKPLLHEWSCMSTPLEPLAATLLPVRLCERGEMDHDIQVNQAKECFGGSSVIMPDALRLTSAVMPQLGA